MKEEILEETDKMDTKENENEKESIRNNFTRKSICKWTK